MSINDVSVMEAQTIVFTVTLSPANLTQTVTVDWATQDVTATGNVDYQAIPPSVGARLTFSPGQTSHTITLDGGGDLLDEPVETFVVNLSNPVNATISKAQGVATITDDDPPPSLVINNMEVVEGSGGTTNAVFTVTLSGASAQTVTVDLSTADGTATAGADYQAFSGALTFSPGQTSQSVAISVLADLLDEPEENYVVNLSNPANATIGDGQGVGTIYDDDEPPTLSVSDGAATEGGTIVFTVSLSAVSAFTVEVDYATADGTAKTATGDYTYTAGRLTFLPGETSQSFAVPVLADPLDETTESFVVNLSNLSNSALSDGQGVGTIYDDSEPPSLSIGDVEMPEAATLVFTVTLSPASAQTVTVDWTTVDVTATGNVDYQAASGTLTFLPGQTSHTITLAGGHDLVDEPASLSIGDAAVAEGTGGTTTAEFTVTLDPAESFLINLSNPVNATISDGQAGGRILDDDDSFTSPVTVGFSTVDGTAAAGTDYTATSGSLSFVPGETAKIIAVAITTDGLDEYDETFSVNLSNATGSALIGVGSAQGTVLDDDPEPEISIGDVSLDEDFPGLGEPGVDNAVFAVTLSAESGKTVTVDFATADGTAIAGSDYTAKSGNLTFAPGETSQQVAVTVSADGDFEPDETFQVLLSQASNGTIVDGQGEGLILNDDAPPSLSIADISLTEGDEGTTDAVFTVHLSEPTFQTVTVDYSTADGTAMAGSDYAAANGTLSFAPGAVEQQIPVAVKGDLLDEDNEIFFLNLSNPANADLPDNQGQAEIADNDPMPTLSIGDVSLAEGNTGTTGFTFAVRLSNPSSRTISVGFATADGTAIAGSDYTAQTGTLTFAPGDIEEDLVVNVLGDIRLEDDERFYVNLLGETAQNASVQDGQGVGTIANDDVNQPPVAGDDAATTAEDTPVDIAVLGNDTDVDGNPLSVTAATNGLNGTTQVTGGTISYTPDANFNGEDGFSYTLSDGQGGSATGQVTVTVTPVNDVPVAGDDVASTAEDTPVTIMVLDNDSDIDSPTLSVSGVTAPAHGGVQVNADGTITYTPAADFNGEDEFTYTLSDGQGGTDVGTVVVTVTPVDDAPVAVADVASTDEDTPVTVTVLVNDTDVDGGSLSVSVATPGSNGTTQVNGDGTILYTPDLNFNGADQFSYTLNGGSTAAVVVMVTPVNDAPVAVADVASTLEDQAVTVSVLANDSDADGDPLSATVATAPGNGSVQAGEGGILTYTPAADFFGTDEFTYTVSDGQGGSDVGSVIVTVTPVNDAPVAGDDVATTAEDTPIGITVLANDTDVDGDALSVSAVAAPAHGSAVLNGDGTITYTPATDFSGTDGFSYTLSDGTATDVGQVAVTVNAVNDSPVAGDDVATTAEDTPIGITVLANDTDVDGDALSVSAVAAPAHGAVVLNAGGTITYTPAADFSGTDGFSYTLSDGTATDVGQVAVTVNAVNDAPVAVDDAATTAEDNAVVIDVLANDSDIDSPALSVTAATNGNNGTTQVNPDGTITYTPAADFYGEDQFTYTLSDGAATATATVVVTVTPVDDAPVAALTGSWDVALGGGSQVHSQVRSGGNFRFYEGSKHLAGLLDGSIEAEGDVRLDAYNHVTGDVTAGGRVVLPPRKLAGTVVIDGTLSEHAEVEPVALPPVVLLVDPTGAPRVTVKKRETRELAPYSPGGSPYGMLRVEQNATLILRSGTYYFERFIVYHHARLILDLEDGPITVNIKEGMHIGARASMTLQGGDAGDVLFNIAGAGLTHQEPQGDDDSDNWVLRDRQGRLDYTPTLSIRILNNAQFFGTIYAPQGKVRVGRQSQVTGALLARQVRLYHQVAFEGQVARALDLSGPSVLAKRAVAADLPQGFELKSNYPNPFNPSTVLSYALSDISQVRLAVYNLLGQQVRVLVDEVQGMGVYTVEWDGLDDAGRALGSGVYLYRLEIGARAQVRKMTLIR